jgi:hypothetical protein
VRTACCATRLEALYTMTASDLTGTLCVALNATGLHQVTVWQRPGLLSDNRPPISRPS